MYRYIFTYKYSNSTIQIIVESTNYKTAIEIIQDFFGVNLKKNFTYKRITIK